MLESLGMLILTSGSRAGAGVTFLGWLLSHVPLKLWAQKFVLEEMFRKQFSLAIFPKPAVWLLLGFPSMSQALQ
jgi:hypothetical protein